MIVEQSRIWLVVSLCIWVLASGTCGTYGGYGEAPTGEGIPVYPWFGANDMGWCVIGPFGMNRVGRSGNVGVGCLAYCIDDGMQGGMYSRFQTL